MWQYDVSLSDMAFDKTIEADLNSLGRTMNIDTYEGCALIFYKQDKDPIRVTNDVG